jgi:molybdenum cofactor guanylyltransferase
MTDRSLLITGVVLAGGLGRRMGGVDKGLQLLDGKPLAAYVIERLAPQVDLLLVSANRNADAYATFGHPVIADRIGGYVGPLAGIHAGLSVCTTPLLACAPCDSPRLPDDLVARLRKKLEESDANIVIPTTASGLQPAFALMRRDVLPNLAAYLASGRRRMQDWLSELQLGVVQFDDERAFFNANTPADLIGEQTQLN